MNTHKTKVLYIINKDTGFKKTDELIFHSIFDLRKLNFVSFLDYFNPKIIIDTIFCSSIIIWFASKHAIPIILLNYLFKNKIFIIAGGYDVAKMPEINYGSMRFGSKRTIVNWILLKAHNVIAVSKSNRDEILNNTKVTKDKIRLIYNCVQKSKVKYDLKKDNIIITVGEVNEETYLRKGLDRFIKVARLMPEIEFIHIGKWTDKNGNRSNKTIKYVKRKSPSNIKFLGYLKRKELIKYYNISNIYLQLSRHEAFGISVLEAMSYGCIPIVSNIFSLPEIIGEHGYIVNNIKETKEKIRLALNDRYYKVPTSHLQTYSIKKRTASFKKLISN